MITVLLLIYIFLSLSPDLVDGLINIPILISHAKVVILFLTTCQLGDDAHPLLRCSCPAFGHLLPDGLPMKEKGG